MSISLWDSSMGLPTDVSPFASDNMTIISRTLVPSGFSKGTNRNFFCDLKKLYRADRVLKR
jgi:hypothetical protein